MKKFKKTMTEKNEYCRITVLNDHFIKSSFEQKKEDCKVMPKTYLEKYCIIY